ncbi:nuclear transport factor 2 family protein [Fodinibius sp. AD559]|uniref:nuclear transport factor 2 family protein n=1 Tax=Fodinibius sp. AD559 TaxID=3424179 RepID=UPI004046EB6A
MRLFYGLLIIFLFTLSSISYGQEPNSDDVGSIDNVIEAIYDVISGPAGERDWERFSSLFKDGASMGAMTQSEDGELRFVSMTPKEYKQRNAEYFKKNGFWEEEIGREIFQFGEIATVQTSFKIKSAKDGDVTRRGVNSVQLVYDQDRWWITNITWNSEREDNKIPEQLLKDTM